VRIRVPSSRASLRIRLSPVDVTLAAVSPFAALYLRNVDLVSAGGMIVADTFALISMVTSLIALRAFRVSSTIPRYISVGDLLNLGKAVLAGELMTAIVLFTITRLDGIPRSVPAIHALIFGAGLLASRGLANLVDRNRRRGDRPRGASAENVILIGLNDWSALLVKYLRTRAAARWRVIALLDEEPRWTGRSVGGVQIFGPPSHLEPLIEEFAAHGVLTDRVVVGVEADELSNNAMSEVRSACARRNLDLVFVPQLLGQKFAEKARSDADRFSGLRSDDALPVNIPLLPYHRYRRGIDAVIAMVLLLYLLPLLALTAIVVSMDVGSPVLFWQQRSGRNGWELQLYKFRTLRPPFDRRGQRIPEDHRLSWIGRLLRCARIDELPQLLNVLVGDMSLVGPRPLLPQDQPPSSALRLMVRPGITGWAQVNGGTLLSPTEKEALDVWYIRNASPWLDVRIAGMTLLTLLRGERRSAKALAQAHILQTVSADRFDRASRLGASLQFAGTVNPRREETSGAPAAGSR
jgi:lipopolysaccharide/colanic/teichoic acid biosynthesis glycosyltransferase